MTTPNFTTDDAEVINKASIKLSNYLKQVPNSKEKAIEFQAIIRSIMDARLEELLQKPLFYQMLFIAADKGVEETLELIHDLTSPEEEENVQ